MPGNTAGGFAVVVEQIKKLAEQSHEAVRRSSGLVQEIESGVRQVVTSVDLEKSAVERGILEMAQTKERMDLDFTRIQEVDTLIGRSSIASRRQTEHMTHTTSMLKEVVDAVNQTMGNVDDTLELTHQQRRQIGKLNRVQVNLGRSSDAFSHAVQKVGFNSKTAIIPASVSGIIDQLVLLAKDSAFILDENSHQARLTQLMQRGSGIEAIWSNRSDGAFIFSMPEAGLLNAKGRERWRRAMEGNVYTSEVYISAITKKPCLTVSVPVVSDHGQVLRVIGADIGVK